MKLPALKASYSQPISLALNPDDEARIKKWGFPKWWNWACDKQERRLAKNGRLRKGS